MPMTYRIDPEASLLLIDSRGVITQAERIAVLDGWLNDPAFKPGIDTFCDFSEAQSTPTLAELRELIDIIQQRALSIGPTRLAILTAKPITFAVARVFEALAEVEATPLQVKVFFDRKKAWLWLRPDEPVRDS